MHAGYCRSRVLIRSLQRKNLSDSKKANRHNRVRYWLGSRLAVCLFLLCFGFHISVFPIPGNAQVSPSGAAVSETAARGAPDYTVSANRLSIPAKAAKRLELAQKRFDKMDVRGALSQIDEALQIDPACARAYSMRSYIKLAANDFSGAVADSIRAVELDSQDAESYIALAMAYNDSGEFQKAAEAAGHALGVRPDDWQGRLELAKSLYGQGEDEKALNLLDVVIRDFPDVHLVRADVLMRLGRSGEAAGEFSLFLKQEPNDPRDEQIRRIVAAAQQSPADTSPTQR